MSRFNPDVIIAIRNINPSKIMRTYIKKPIFTVGFEHDNHDNKMKAIKDTR